MMVRKKELYPKLYELQNLESISTVRQFDELYTAPHGGFSDAEDYYAKASALPLLSKIRCQLSSSTPETTRWCRLLPP